MTAYIRRRRAVERSRGTEFIEFALALPFLTLIAMGIVEMGLGWMATNDLNAAARDAARSGTSAPAYASSDRTILVTLGSTLSASEVDVIEKVIVFRANAQGQATSQCKNSTTPSTGGPGTARGQSGDCNVYSKDQVKWAVNNPSNSTYFATSLTSCNGTQLDRNWCPSTRNHSQATGTLDYLGVRVVMKHKTVTHFGFGDMTITRQAVFRLEPKYGEN